MAPKSAARKEFRTTVILTAAQVRRIRELAAANDASIAWILRQAVDKYLAANGRPGRKGRASFTGG
jgi:hypothetical protein